MELTYKEYSEKDLDKIIDAYRNYYNADGGSWTYEKAYRRIHQLVSMEDSLVLLQFDKDRFTGFLMGYLKQFDDSLGFYLEEILIFEEFQNKGFGSDFLRHLEWELRRKNCDWIELLTTTGQQHQKFYGKNGYTRSENLVLEYRDLE